MKIDRLLEIIIYLLNHESVTAKVLSEKFEVSVRTIQRDMETLLVAGIPIDAAVGASGGYTIESSYKLRNSFVKKEDFELIVMALKSLSTSYDSDRLESILDHYTAVGSNENRKKVYLDYSVSKEDQKVQGFNKRIEFAIEGSLHITFEYCNINNYVSKKKIMPLALRFKWYAWYLFGIDAEKSVYRTYKIARMDNLAVTSDHFDPMPRKEVEALIRENDAAYLATCDQIEVWCSAKGMGALREYFPEEEKEALESGDYIMHLRVPPNERLWQALLLSMGDQVIILSPAHYRDKLIKIAQNFLSNYDI